MEETPLQTGEPEKAGCASCGNPNVLHEYNVKLCSECREKFIKFPIPKWILAFGLVIALAMLYSFFNLPKSISMGVAFEKGMRAEKQHNYLTAQHEFEKVVAKAPDYKDGQGHLLIAASYNFDLKTFGQAYTVLEDKSLDQALYADISAALERMTAYLPGDSLSQFAEGLHYKVKDLPDSCLVKYLKVHKDDLYAQNRYGAWLLEKNQYKGCDSVGQAMLNIEPTHVGALMMMASLKRQIGAYDSSIFYCEKILSVNREYSSAIASEARTYLKKKDDKEALKLAQKAFDIDKNDGYAAATLGLVYHLTSKPQQRDELINQLKKDSSSVTYLQYLLDVMNKKEKFRD